MKLTHFIFLFLFVLAAACTEQNKKTNNTHQVKVVEAKGYVVPKDSMETPKVILVDESKLKKIPAGNPTVNPTNLNVHIAGIPKVITAGVPCVCTPGKDTFLLPKTVPTTGITKLAGIPEIVIAKDMVNKDQNPQNFSSFKKQQGLKNDNVTCLLEDKSGNLWFATRGGGVGKYDGKYFTYLTEKEGLLSDEVLSILEDKNGNFWFATLGGVSKYDGKSFTNFTKKEGLFVSFQTKVY